MGIYCLIPALIALSSCTTARYNGSPDFSAAESRLEQAYQSADPATRKHLEAAKAQLASAKQLCLTNTEELEQAIIERNSWKEKQRKALKELWIYRGAIIALVLWVFKGSILGGIMFVARKFVGVPW